MCIRDRSLEASGLGRYQVERTDRGKPYIRNCDRGRGEDCGEDCGAGGEIHVSVSHSGRYFLCLIADRPAGVDVQEERETAVEKISRRYFTAREQRFVQEAGACLLYTSVPYRARYRSVFGKLYRSGKWRDRLFCGKERGIRTMRYHRPRRWSDDAVWSLLCSLCQRGTDSIAWRDYSGGGQHGQLHGAAPSL